MGKFVNSGIGIKAIATVVPNNKYSHADNVERFGIDIVEKFEKLTGIYSTYKVSIHQTASDLGYIAACKLIEKFSICPEEIGVLVFASPSLDYIQPPTACVLQYRLGLSKECAALDITHGCSAFVYGSQVIESMMMSTTCRYGLLIVGDTNSKNVNVKDNSYMLTSDSSSAVLFCRDEYTKTNILLKTDGSQFRDIIIPGRGMRDLFPSKEEILCQDGVYRTKYDWYMNGMNVFAFATRAVPKAIYEYVDWIGTSIADYDSIAFHQANGIIIKRLIKILKLDGEKVPNSISNYGNTGGNSLLLTLCDRYGNDNSKNDVKILAAAFGVGLSLGVMSFLINTDNILPIFTTDEVFSEGVIDLAEI